jgi:hypothetical protein
MRHARACSPERAALTTTSAASPAFAVPNFTRAHVQARGTARGRHPAFLACRVVRSAKGPIRILCMPHPTLSGRRSSSIRRSSEPMKAGALWRGRLQMLHPLGEQPDGFQRLGRRTRPHSRASVYDSATTRHSQACMCSSVCKRPFIVPPSPHMART